MRLQHTALQRLVNVNDVSICSQRKEYRVFGAMQIVTGLARVSRAGLVVESRYRLLVHTQASRLPHFLTLYKRTQHTTIFHWPSFTRKYRIKQNYTLNSVFIFADCRLTGNASMTVVECCHLCTHWRDASDKNACQSAPDGH